MLRASALAFGYRFDPRSVADPSVGTGIPGGDLLPSFVDTLLGRREGPLRDVSHAIVELLGPGALVDAAAVFGNFEMMNRVAEGTGIPVTPQAIARDGDLIEALELQHLVDPEPRE